MINVTLKSRDAKKVKDLRCSASQKPEDFTSTMH